MNPFQEGYDYRLRTWKNLRLLNHNKPLDELCVVVDNWWQQAPLVTYHLHPLDSDNWPDPWTLISENIYCPLTRALGICYTLLLCDVLEMHLVQAIDQENTEHNLVIVGHAKYVLNYYPNSVLSTNLKDFNIVKELSLDKIRKAV